MVNLIQTQAWHKPTLTVLGVLRLTPEPMIQQTSEAVAPIGVFLLCGR